VGKAPVDVMVDMADIPEDITQAPYNLRMHPSGKFLFVCNWMSASVSVFKVNPDSGELTLVDGSPFITDPHPYDLIVSPDGEYLYTAHWAVNSIVSFKIAPDSGKLARLQPERMDTLGQGPVDLWFDPSYSELYVSHYLSHNIASYRYDANNGSLHLTNSTPSRFGPRAMDFAYGEAAVRYSSDYLFGISAINKSLFAYKISGESGELHPQASIALSAVPVALAYDKVNRLVYVATDNPDQIQVFSLQNGESFEEKTPTPVTVKETPTDIAVGPNGLIAYITSAEKDRMLVFERHPVTGEIREWPESPRTTGSYPTEVKIEPVGRFAFVLNKKSNTISSYRFRTGLWPLIDQIAMTTEFGNKNTQLTNMTTDPLGNFLFATDGNNDEVLVYWINTTSGVFDPAKQSHFKVGAKPVDMVFHPNGKRAYVVNAKSATIETYSIDYLFGKLEKKLQTLKTDKSPRNLQLDASGRFAYLFYQDSNKISMYTLDPASGQLTHQKDLHNDGVIKDAVIDITMH
jgi:6-phosphogluconolactonase (cycloisomerase 2 family)